jgi:hypothetical protein
MGMEIPFYTGGINNVQEGVSLIRRQMMIGLLYRKLEWTWDDSEAIKDEPKIHSSRPQEGRD